MWIWLGVILVVIAMLVLPAVYVVPQWERVAVIRSILNSKNVSNAVSKLMQAL